MEEARTLGKTIVLSDIPVHREQAPHQGVYFDPHEPEEPLQPLFTLSLRRMTSRMIKRWQVARMSLHTGLRPLLRPSRGLSPRRRVVRK